ncbi:MAG: hypothetical protein E6J55_15695 [Deltaproteobacteria bacterium]|nr:MAG: hypothetical protein E6J55_15695 [Deltaproteobacteria bacterium]
MRRPLHWVRFGLAAVSLLVGTPKAHGAGDILSITPRCAPSGASVTIQGRGFGATNVSIVVDGVQAQILHATGNQVVFVIPPQLSPGVVSVAKAVNPGGQTGSIALRIQGPEICGNGTDDDCDGIVDNPQLCAHVNHPPVANAGPDVTAPVGTTVELDGTRSSDPDGDPLTFQWTLVAQPSGSVAGLRARRVTNRHSG